MTKEQKDGVTWFQVNNVIPIITSLVVVAVSWASLSAKIDVLTERLNTSIQNQNTILNKYVSLEERFGNQALAIKELQILAGVR